MIPYGRQSISDEDIEAVTSVLRSDFLTQGPQVPNFEAVIGQYCHVDNAVAVGNATAALHIACLALDAGPGDYVWTSPISFVASANCARYCGASVDFVDINPQTMNMCPHALAKKLEAAELSGTLPKIVIPVHFSGLPCDMEQIHALANQYGFHIIEDASHAIGARYQDTKIGDCRYSDITVFSFHPVKIITTGEGGIATTNSTELCRKMQLLRSHSITREVHELENKDVGPWHYEQQSLGFNCRMTDMQAALGVSQMARLDNWVARRHEIRELYETAFLDLNLSTTENPSDRYSALHLFPIQVENRPDVFEKLRDAGIGVNVHYIPIHTQPYYKKLGFCWGDFPASEHYYERAISLPIYGTLSNSDVDFVISHTKTAVE